MVTDKNKVTLFAIPFAGGNKYSFNAFKGLFLQKINFFPLELPGRGARINERLKLNMEDLVDDLFSQVEAQLIHPYAFYGHSLGAMLAYLLTRRIIAENKKHPVQLFVSGRGGPSNKDERQRHLLPKSEFINMLADLGGMDEDVVKNDALMDFFEPILRADLQAVETYQHQIAAPINIPITVLMGINDKATIEEVESWQKETVFPINLHQFPGGHFFVFDHCRSIADIIINSLLPASLK